MHCVINFIHLVHQNVYSSLLVSQECIMPLGNPLTNSFFSSSLQIYEIEELRYKILLYTLPYRTNNFPSRKRAVPGVFLFVQMMVNLRVLVLECQLSPPIKVYYTKLDFQDLVIKCISVFQCMIRSLQAICLFKIQRDTVGLSVHTLIQLLRKLFRSNIICIRIK